MLLLLFLGFSVSHKGVLFIRFSGGAESHLRTRKFLTWNHGFGSYLHVAYLLALKGQEAVSRCLEPVQDMITVHTYCLWVLKIYFVS